MVYDELKSHIGFKKTPFNPGDDGEAFMGFLGFACSRTDEANHLHDAFKKSNAFNETDEGKQAVAAFIDWAIENVFGEEAATTQKAEA